MKSVPKARGYVGAATPCCTRFSALVRRSSGNAESRAEESRIGGEANVQAMPASSDSCRSFPECVHRYRPGSPSRGVAPGPDRATGQLHGERVGGGEALTFVVADERSITAGTTVHPQHARATVGRDLPGMGE